MAGIGREPSILPGTRHGMLTVIAIEYRNKRRFAVCRCDCGSTSYRTSTNNFKKVFSCGCVSEAKKVNSAYRHRLNALLTTYRHNATKRNRPFELTIQEFEYFVTGACYYCGAAPNTAQRTKRDRRLNQLGTLFNGIDREQQEAGYTLLNCRSCCQTCNYAKGTMSANEYFALCDRVSAHAKTARRSLFD